MFRNACRSWKSLSRTVKMLCASVSEKERYLYSASTSKSPAAQAAAPEARVVNSISCMFIVVVPDALWLFLPAGGAVPWLVKQANGVTAVIMAGGNFPSAVTTQPSPHKDQLNDTIHLLLSTPPRPPPPQKNRGKIGLKSF